MSEIVFDTTTEQYLHDNHGKLHVYYDAILRGEEPGQAFVSALSKPDQYRIKVGRHFELTHKDTEIDGDDIIAAIKFLEDTKTNYSEDHPLWNLR